MLQKTQRVPICFFAFQNDVRLELKKARLNKTTKESVHRKAKESVQKVEGTLQGAGDSGGEAVVAAKDSSPSPLTAFPIGFGSAALFQPSPESRLSKMDKKRRAEEEAAIKVPFQLFQGNITMVWIHQYTHSSCVYWSDISIRFAIVYV